MKFFGEIDIFNGIIVLILIIIIANAIRETVKHFKGESGCCGGASRKVKKKKLRNKIIQRYILRIDGMHCKNCANAVTEIINDYAGAAGRVNLKRGEALVLCDREIDIEEIKAKIRIRGYEVV